MGRNIDNYANEYVRSSFESILVKYRREQCLKVIHQFPHSKILEIGCGMYPLFPDVKDFESFFVLEPAAAFCDNARMLAKEDSRIIIIQDFFEKQVKLFKDIDFDIIIVSALLHEVESPELLLESIHQCCSDDTVVHLNVPNSFSFHMLLAYESQLINKIGDLSDRALLLQQHTTFDINSLTTLVTDFGFELLDKGSYYIKPFNHEKMEKMLELGLIDQNILDGFSKMIKYMPELGAEIYINVKKKYGKD